MFLSLNATELKQCETEQDKISGCVEINEAKFGTTTTPYKNGKINGVEIHKMENGFTIHTNYVDDKKQGEEKIFNEIGEKKLVATLTFKNDTLISGRCENGKKFTKAMIAKYNEGELDFCK